MKLYMTIFAVAFFCGCADHDTLEGVLCQRWVQNNSDIACTTEFRSDGTVLVDYENGTDLEGTWRKSGDNTIAIAISDWQMTGRLEDRKLIVRNGKNEKTYSVKLEKSNQ